MDLQQLQYFVTSAQMLNFTAAANHHYITQPTMCRQINALEKELSVKLFQRSTHGIQLTPAGEEFLEYAVDALRRSEQIKTRVQNVSDGQLGIVKLSALPSSTHILTRCISAFSRRFPHIQIDIDLPTGVGQIDAINRSTSDFYFAFTSMVAHRDGLEHLETFVDQYCLVVHEKHAKGIDPDDFSSLSHRPFVMISQAMGPVIFDQAMEICRRRNCTPHIVNFYTHAASSLISVDAGVGMTILPRTLVEPTAGKHLMIYPIRGEDAKISYAVAWHRRSENQAAKKFLNVVRSLYDPANT